KTIKIRLKIRRIGATKNMLEKRNVSGLEIAIGTKMTIARIAEYEGSRQLRRHVSVAFSFSTIATEYNSSLVARRVRGAIAQLGPSPSMRRPVSVKSVL